MRNHKLSKIMFLEKICLVVQHTMMLQTDLNMLRSKGLK